MGSKANICLAAVFLALFAVPGLAQFSQQRSGFQPGVTDPVDSILARRIVMTTLGRQNDQVHDIIDLYGPAQEQDARLRLDNIGAFLLGFAEMFPPNSYIYSEELAAEDPSTVTLALPSVWENWDDFYSRTLAAADTAYRAGRAGSWEELVALTEELEGQCESCHTLYRQNPEPFDIDSLTGN